MEKVRWLLEQFVQRILVGPCLWTMKAQPAETSTEMPPTPGEAPA